MKLWAVVPELIVAGGCLALVPVAGWARHGRLREVPWMLALGLLAAALVSTAHMFGSRAVGAFEGIYAVDGFAHAFKVVVLVASAVSLLLIRAYFAGRPELAHAPVALLFATLGALGAVSSTDLGLILLFLQMMSFSSYLLVGMLRGDRLAQEATLKYFLFGAVALAVMGYGLSFLFGLTGSLRLQDLGPTLAGADRVWVAVAFAFILAGYGFEMTLVPFHFWSPDAVTGAAAPIAGFVSVVPKIAGTAALLRMLLHAFGGELAAWPVVMACAAAVTMTAGNLTALHQGSLKRLLAYSSIAQAGYVLLAVAVAERVPEAVPAAVYYLAVYVFMNLGAFGVVSQVERATGSDRVAALAGLSRRAPGAAAVLTLALLSLAGIPPLGGFAGKILVLNAALDGGMAWLAVVAAANWVLALVYYLRVVGAIYLETDRQAPPLHADRAHGLMHAFNTAGTVALGILPGPVLQWLDTATRLLR